MSDRQIFDPPHLLKHFPVSNFHWGLRQAGWIHLAGQGGIDKDGSVPASLHDQTLLALRTIDEILDALGGKNTDIVNMNLFFVLQPGETLLDALAEFAGAKDSMWPGCAPVGLAVPVAALFYPGLRAEIQVVAATT